MKRIAVALVVGIASAGLLAGCRSQEHLNTNKGRFDIEIHVAMQNGLCQVKQPVDVLGGKKNQPISWLVKNDDCDIPQYVTFSEYREYLANGGYGPVDTTIVDPNLAASKQIERTRDDKVLARIAKGVKNTDVLYKYKICTGPFPNPTQTCLDPDVDVWP